MCWDSSTYSLKDGLLFAEIDTGLPVHRHWDSATCCVLPMTMHSAALFLASHDIDSILTRPFLCLLDTWWDLGNAIGHPKPGLGVPVSGHRTASFLEQRSVVSFSDVALQPARELDSLLGLVSMTRH